jgi:hypothetical protein
MVTGFSANAEVDSPRVIEPAFAVGPCVVDGRRPTWVEPACGRRPSIGLISQLHFRMTQRCRISLLTGGKTRTFGNSTLNMIRF